MKEPRKPPRDQRESAFSEILGGLVPRVPGARAAALVDSLGETVDYAGRRAPYDVRVAAAHLRIVLFAAQALKPLEGVKWCAVRASRGGYLVHALPEGYALVLVFVRGAGLAGWQRAVAACGRALASEAGWPKVDSWCEPWFAVDVIPDGRRRPRSLRVAGRVRTLEIVGVLASRPNHATRASGARPSAAAKGWRVRLETGAETTLIREPGGAWYSDESLEGVLGSGSPLESTLKKRR